MRDVNGFQNVSARDSTVDDDALEWTSRGLVHPAIRAEAQVHSCFAQRDRQARERARSQAGNRGAERARRNNRVGRARKCDNSEPRGQVSGGERSVYRRSGGAVAHQSRASGGAAAAPNGD